MLWKDAARAAMPECNSFCLCGVQYKMPVWRTDWKAVDTNPLALETRSGDRMPVVVFDIGNVLLRWDPRNLYRKLFAESTQMEWFLANVCDGCWNEAQDKGRKWAEAVTERIRAFPQWETEIRAYDERWIEMLGGEISENVAILRKLKDAGVPTFAITNFSSEKFAITKLRYQFFKLFDGIVVSGHEGLIKPDLRIFQLFLERYGYVAEECVFIDDNQQNVEAAREIGMGAIHYVESLNLSAALSNNIAL
jgi:2-haloacid dehalogenase